jgi:hypothetical protein
LSSAVSAHWAAEIARQCLGDLINAIPRIDTMPYSQHGDSTRLKKKVFNEAMDLMKRSDIPLDRSNSVQ